MRNSTSLSRSATVWLVAAAALLRHEAQALEERRELLARRRVRSSSSCASAPMSASRPTTETVWIGRRRPRPFPRRELLERQREERVCVRADDGRVLERLEPRQPVHAAAAARRGRRRPRAPRARAGSRRRACRRSTRSALRSARAPSPRSRRARTDRATPDERVPVAVLDLGQHKGSDRLQPSNAEGNAAGASDRCSLRLDDPTSLAMRAGLVLLCLAPACAWVAGPTAKSRGRVSALFGVSVSRAAARARKEAEAARGGRVGDRGGCAEEER